MANGERESVERQDGTPVEIGAVHPDTVQSLLGISSYAWSQDPQGRVSYYPDVETAKREEERR